MTIKSKLIYSVTFSAILLASGCSLHHNNAYEPVNTPLTGVKAHTDAKILADVIVLNKNEIAAAADAQQKASSKAVRSYASMLYKAHSKNLQDTRTLGQKLGLVPEESNVAVMLQKNGQRELAHLNSLQGPAFDKAYIAAMIKDHSAALNLIDQKLLPQANNPAVRRHLEITRAHVLNHLQQAKLVQKEMGM